MPITASKEGDAMRGYALGLYEKSMPESLSLRDKLEAAKRCGYDFLELSIDETDKKLNRLAWSPEERLQILRDMAETGLPIRSICLSGHRRFPLGHPDPEVRNISLAVMRSAIALAEDLGVRLIQIAGYDVYYETGTEQTGNFFAENLQRSVEAAEKAGVMLAFETMETEFLNTVSKGMDWVRRIRSPYLQMYPDIGNTTNALLNSSVSPEEDLKTGQGHLAAVHLKETRPGVFREVPYGEGHVAFQSLCQTAYALGVRRFLAEFWNDDAKPWEAELLKNCQFLRNFLDQAEAAAEPLSFLERPV